MKAESQNIEWKENWRDEYLKWICGFANAQGGKIYIGINDKGEVNGLNDAKKLLEDIPNKTKNHMGILVDVNLKTKAKKSYIEIVVEPYPNPISYLGDYHFRSGSTKQTLRGSALDKFLLQKQGKHWDGLPQPNLLVKDLSNIAIQYFKDKAANNSRIDLTILKEKTPQLLEKLHLKANDTYLKRACVLLFHPDPEKYFTGAYVKIGFFNADDDLAYQDEIHGHLFEQVEKTMDLLLTKYLKAAITYEGIYRLEKYAVPQKALREALLNAIIHKDYSSGNPIQISVYKNKLIIWNAGHLPENWTISKLKTKHSSQPNNPDIANCFFRAGLIEAWGQGTLRIIKECKNEKINTPVFNNEDSEFWIEFHFKEQRITNKVNIKLKGTNKDKVLQLLLYDGSLTIAQIAAKIGVAEITIKRIIKELQNDDIIIREGSNKIGAWIVNMDIK